MLGSSPVLANVIDFSSGALSEVGEVLLRRVSDLVLLFGDKAAAEVLAEGDNPVVYQVFLPPEREPGRPEALLYATTVIYPGKVGDEYFMTKGHFHVEGECPEVYLGTAGRGMLLLMDRHGRAEAVPMQAGTVVYVPPETAHRTVNVGDAPFVFFAVWPEKAGHDYQSIAAHGFSHRILEEHGRPVMVSNPDWRQP
ncbi:cupin domain-containing protein [bacterium]|nr:cupin domain-containing protein [bacterium]